MTVNKKRTIIFLALAIALLVVLISWITFGNTALKLNKYTVTSNKLPKEFEGFRIAHISDLHNTEIGKDNKKLISMLENSKPNIIAITGDLVDSRHTNIDIALRFAEKAIKIAPCYYVSGNHEARVNEYEKLKESLTKLGVVILENERIKLERKGETITLIGIEDPSFKADYLFDDADAITKNELESLINADDNYTVLLSHRPELFETYVESGINLIFSGHAHGGQFRLPLVGGLIAPNQGLFPKYDSGLFTKENTTMVVSKGIGNSIIPLRVNNRPEVILIELESVVL